MDRGESTCCRAKKKSVPPPGAAPLEEEEDEKGRGGGAKISPKIVSFLASLLLSLRIVVVVEGGEIAMMRWKL